MALQKIGSSSLGRDRFCRSAAFCRGALSWELCVIRTLVLCADTANCGINRQKYAISIMLRSQGDCVYMFTSVHVSKNKDILCDDCLSDSCKQDTTCAGDKILSPKYHVSMTAALQQQEAITCRCHCSILQEARRGRR